MIKLSTADLISDTQKKLLKNLWNVTTLKSKTVELKKNIMLIFWPHGESICSRCCWFIFAGCKSSISFVKAKHCRCKITCPYMKSDEKCFEITAPSSFRTPPALLMLFLKDTWQTKVTLAKRLRQAKQTISRCLHLLNKLIYKSSSVKY